MRINIRLTFVMSLLLIVVACSNSKFTISSRLAEYQESRNAAALKLPPDIQAHTISDRYYVPVLTSPQSYAVTSLLPPGSLAAKQAED